MVGREQVHGRDPLSSWNHDLGRSRRNIRAIRPGRAVTAAPPEIRDHAAPARVRVVLRNRTLANLLGEAVGERARLRIHVSVEWARYQRWRSSDSIRLSSRASVAQLMVYDRCSTLSRALYAGPQVLFCPPMTLAS